MGITELFRLDGKVAVITGASSGLGVAFASHLAEAGADIVVGARRLDRLSETADLVRRTDRECVSPPRNRITGNSPPWPSRSLSGFKASASRPGALTPSFHRM